MAGNPVLFLRSRRQKSKSELPHDHVDPSQLSPSTLIQDATAIASKNDGDDMASEQVATESQKPKQSRSSTAQLQQAPQLLKGLSNMNHDTQDDVYQTKSQHDPPLKYSSEYNHNQKPQPQHPFHQPLGPIRGGIPVSLPSTAATGPEFRKARYVVRRRAGSSAGALLSPSSQSRAVGDMQRFLERSHVVGAIVGVIPSSGTSATLATTPEKAASVVDSSLPDPSLGSFAKPMPPPSPPKAAQGGSVMLGGGRRRLVREMVGVVAVTAGPSPPHLDSGAPGTSPKSRCRRNLPGLLQPLDVVSDHRHEAATTTA